MSIPLLERALAARDALIAKRDALLAKVAGEERANLTEAEDVEFRSIIDEITPFDERIEELRTQEVRDAEARAAASAFRMPEIRVQREPLTYERGNRAQSYFRDLGLAYVGNDEEARGRLTRHRSEVEVELPKIEARREAAFQRALDEMRGGVEHRDITRVDGAGGEFVPPLWIMEEYAEFLRAGRVSAGLCRSIPLPSGTDSINVPRLSGGTTTAAQTADNAAVSETDLTTNSVQAGVKTIAGQQDVALQLLEQSPLVFDEIVFADLTADYNAKLDIQVLNGTNANGQHRGILVASGTNSVAYTDASPTVPEFWPIGSQAISQAASGRKTFPPSAVVMHSRRWYWMESTLDTANRPLVVPTMQGPVNTFASPTGVVAEGLVGYWHGLPVYLDQNMPVTLGGGTEDAVLIARWADMLLFEGALRTRALPEVGSGTLTVRLQVYAYSAFLPDRYPLGVSKITGTGLAAPSGF